jgi:protein phosphatase
MKPTDNPHVNVAALSHPGEVREINEDRYAVVHFVDDADGVPSTLAIVADGIGGHQAGEVASQITIDELTRSLTASEGIDIEANLEQAVIGAGRAVTNAAAQDESLQGMGSTVAVAWIIDHHLHIVTVGDSRIYFVRDDELRQISIDHTWVQEAINHGILSPEEARNHPNAHVLHRHLGGDKDPVPDPRLRLSADESDEQSRSNQGLKLQPGDQILLCSDGLTDLVEDHEILDTLRSASPGEAASRLVDQARARGGHDNITVVVVSDPSGEAAGGRLPPALTLTVAGLSLLVLIALGLGVSYWLGFWPR